MKKYPALDLHTIKDLEFPKEQYYQENTTKKQICLHHTASGKGIDGDYKWWLADPRRVATQIIIDFDGTINRLYSSQYWGHHLGTKQANNTALNKACIGIEIDSWGPLVKFNGAYRSYLGTIVPKEEVEEYFSPFKTLPGGDTYFSKIGAAGQGAFFYQKYSDKQIFAVAQLLELWGEGYNIPLTYNEGMWALNGRALAGDPGVWTHVSYREDKQDCHPQPELISMLKSLTATV